MRKATLMLAGQAQASTEQDVRAVITPEWNPDNPTYQPVDYNLILDIVQNNTNNLGFDLVSQEYALSSDNQRMFGAMSFDVGHKDYALNFVLRGSHDKSLSLAFAAGPAPWVCANGCISGDFMVYMRKHTKHCLGEVHEQIELAVYNWKQSFESTVKELEEFKTIKCSLDRGYELIGLAQGRGIVKSTAANIARKDWKTPRHSEFEEKNLFSLYNCFTEGIKTGDNTRQMSKQIKIHQFAKEVRNGHFNLLQGAQAWQN